MRPADSTVTLPFDEDPPYKTYHCLGAHPLSILGAVSDLKPLLASDYIVLSCLKTPHLQGSFGTFIVPWRTIGKFASLGYCELLDVKERLSFKMTNSRDLIQWMIDRIHDKWYLISHVNEYYIPGSWANSKQDFLHDCLIFGCDTEKKIFKVAMYLATGTYDIASVPFACMAMALTLRGSKYLTIFSICHTPMILSVRPRAQMQIAFDRNAACKNLKAHLSSTPPDEGIYTCDDPVYAGDWMQAFGYPIGSHMYGLEAFSTIVSHIRAFLKRGSAIDIRDTRALWEHKKIMHSNIKYWGAQPCIADRHALSISYEAVVNWAHSLHLMCLEYRVDDRRNGLELMLHLDKAGGMIEMEKAILLQCYWKLGRVARPSCDSFSSSGFGAVSFENPSGKSAAEFSPI